MGKRKSVKNNLAGTKVRDGEEVLQVLEQIPLQPMEETMLEQVVPLPDVKEQQVGADIHPASCGGHDGGAGGYDVKEAAACGDAMQEQASGKSCSLWR